ERMISLGKKGDLHSRRMAGAYLLNRGVVSRLFSDLAPRFSEKKGGYTRLIKTRVRYGDAASMAIVELTEMEAGDQGVGKAEKPPKKVKEDKDKKEKLPAAKKKKSSSDTKKKTSSKTASS
ncbi:MAG: 50S ribosomal protein L17, partial [Nitrospiria bacterium]